MEFHSRSIPGKRRIVPFPYVSSPFHSHFIPWSRKCGMIPGSLQFRTASSATLEVSTPYDDRAQRSASPTRLSIEGKTSATQVPVPTNACAVVISGLPLDLPPDEITNTLIEHNRIYSLSNYLERSGSAPLSHGYISLSPCQACNGSTPPHRAQAQTLTLHNVRPPLHTRPAYLTHPLHHMLRPTPHGIPCLPPAIPTQTAPRKGQEILKLNQSSVTPPPPTRPLTTHPIRASLPSQVSMNNL